MINILFVCHGNVCRSPMAEFAMKKLVKDNGLSGEFFIESAAATDDAIGAPVYSLAADILQKNGIDCSEKRSRKLKKGDLDKFDYIIAMDNENMRDIRRILGKECTGKLHMLLDFTDSPGEIDDPWYTRDFERSWREIVKGCEGLLEAAKVES